MKIFIFAPYFFPHQGGVERYAFETAAGLIQAGHDVDVVTASVPGTKNQEVYKGIRIHRIPTWHLLNGQYPVPKFFAMKKWLEHHKKYDVIITHTRFFVSSFFGARHAKKLGIPHLHIEHGTVRPKTSWWARPVAWVYDKTIGWYVLSRADKVAGVSKAAERFVKDICKRDTFTLYNCVNTNFFKKVPAEKHWKGKIITFVGRLIKAKGVQDLLNATKDMRNITVLVVGSGNYEKKLKSMARNKVKFLGSKNPEEIREILSVTDIFVNPSYAEGLPTSVLEAGSMSLPVVATDVGGTREIIDDKKNGYLVKPESVVSLRHHIQDLLENPQKAKNFGIALQKKVEQTFDWKVTVKKLNKVVKELHDERNS